MKEEPVEPPLPKKKKVTASTNASASGHLQRQGGREGDNKLLDICVIYSEYSAL